MIRHALTIDLEDWYHVANLRPVTPPESWPVLESRLERNTDLVLEILEAQGVQATFFVLGDAANRVPSAVRSIVDAGHELACHGWSHDLIYTQSPDLFREETRRAKALLEDLGSCPVRGYRASTFSIVHDSMWALDVLAEEGFEYDSSIAPLRHDRYGIPGFPTSPHTMDLGEGRSIREFPVSVGTLLGVKLPVGGGFFRLLPLAWTIRALRQLESRGLPGMLYLHPWELDPEQPRVSGVGAVSRFRHYYGLSRTREKLERLCRTCRFSSLGGILDAWMAAGGDVRD